MVFFITCLRALAAGLITNSHYIGIYPTDVIASGGLLGDVIFFAVSGFCLYNVKKNFFQWYGKRIWRVYLPLIIVTAFYFIINAYNVNDYLPSLFNWFVYPTNYHFASSIMILYIPYYFVCKIDKLRKNIPLIMLVLAGVTLVYYIFFYDKSYYHIDIVEEWFIRILFFESMLLGACLREYDSKFRNNKNILWLNITGVVLSSAGYIALKVFIPKAEFLISLQLLSWIMIFAFLFFIFKLASSMDSLLENLPKPIKKVITFISEITLEIYLVQHIIIQNLGWRFEFPLNWVVVTASIIAGALILHIICKGIYKLTEKITGAV